MNLYYDLLTPSFCRYNFKAPGALHKKKDNSSEIDSGSKSSLRSVPGAYTLMKKENETLNLLEKTTRRHSAPSSINKVASNALTSTFNTTISSDDDIQFVSENTSMTSSIANLKVCLIKDL